MKTFTHQLSSLLLIPLAWSGLQPTAIASHQVLISANQDINSLLEQGQLYMDQDQLKKYMDKKPASIENKMDRSKTTGQSHIKQKPDDEKPEKPLKPVKKKLGNPLGKSAP